VARKKLKHIDATLPLPTYVTPGAPVYVTQATAGVFQLETLESPAPAWSRYRTQGVYGWGALTVDTNPQGCSTLLYQFQTQNGKVIDQFMLVRPQPFQMDDQEAFFDL
jgi:hypothetical protein